MIDAVDVVALFGAGVASFLAPCVVPLVPAWLGMVTGSVATSAQRAFGSTLLFVLGFAAVFTALGTAAGAVGSSLDGVQDGLQRVGGVVVAVLGLALLGVLRGPFARERRAVQRVGWAGSDAGITGIVRPVVVGVAFGAAWSPCVGPLLGAALVAAADAGSPGAGAVLLGAYAVGIGVPFLLASLAIGAWPGIGVRLRQIGPRLERIAGVLLVVLGVLLATGAYDHLTSYLARFTPTLGERDVNSTVWLLLVVFLAIAVLDWAAVHTRSKALEYVCKPGCMVVLIAAAAALDPADEGARTALVVALALSTVGDIFLMLRGDRPGLFLAGLAAFLCAHVAYVVAFWLDGVDASGLLLGAVLALLLGLLVGRPVVAAVRAGEEPEMAGAVTAYVAVISAMVLSAAGTGDGRAVVGALLFAGSDSLIARDRFVRPAPWAPLAIIVTYHLAQALLVTSFAQG